MTEINLTHDTIVPFLEDIMERRGAECYLGEPVTMAEHMLQAAFFAEQQGASDELVAAALLHDIGHFTTEFGPYSPDDTKDNLHDRAGVGKVFSPAGYTKHRTARDREALPLRHGVDLHGSVVDGVAAFSVLAGRADGSDRNLGI